MNIKMAGIDHRRAGIETRELFSFTKSGAQKAMKLVREKFNAAGCILLSTCNRTELWLDGAEESPLEILCDLKGLESAQYADVICVRQNSQAVEHLLKTACGMNSQLFGDDQIITQIGQAWDLAREEKNSGPVLDHLFRTAISGAKKVKTQVRLTAMHTGAAESTLELLQSLYADISGKKILVIGNGTMGQLVAAKLHNAGAEVSMTLRQYLHGGASVAEGCSAVAYEDRYLVMEQVDAVVSATASPHYTVQVGPVRSLKQIPPVFVDLAVPRDIEPAVGQISGVKLWDIDKLGASGPEAENEEAMLQ